MTDRLAAVTGATGFLGHRLVEILLERGWRVHALVRRDPTPGQFPASDRLAFVKGDLADTGALEALTEGAEATLHCAGLIKARRRDDFFEINRDGAARIAQIASSGTFLLVSSLAAREPHLSDYAASKRAGEDAARAANGRLSIVRPPAIYGPGDRETLALFKLAASAPVLPLPGGPAARLAVAHVDDVVEAIMAILDGPGVGPRPIAVGGDRPQGYGWQEIFAAAAAEMGRTPRYVRLPPGLIRSASAVSWAVGQIAGPPPIFTPGKAREILHPDWSITLGELAPNAPRARFDLATGFSDTVAWYRAHGWL